MLKKNECGNKGTKEIIKKASNCLLIGLEFIVIISCNVLNTKFWSMYILFNVLTLLLVY